MLDGGHCALLQVALDGRIEGTGIYCAQALHALTPIGAHVVRPPFLVFEEFVYYFCHKLSSYCKSVGSSDVSMK